jgi:hypothetical protein
LDKPDFQDLYVAPVLNLKEKEDEIAALRQELSALNIDADAFVADLLRDVGDDKVTLRALSYSEIAERERIMQRARLAEAASEASVERQRQEHILQLERDSRAQVVALTKADHIVHERVVRQNREQLRQYMRAVQQEFTICETQLRSNIRSMAGHLITQAEEITTKPNVDTDTPHALTDAVDVELAALKRLHALVFTAVKQRRWRIEWEHTPQPLRINLLVLRALKDKVRGSRLTLPRVGSDRSVCVTGAERRVCHARVGV